MVPINRKKLLATHTALTNQGVEYGYGAKAEGGSDPRNGKRWNHKSNGKLSTPLSSIENIDCSGLVRLESYIATDGAFAFDDGSQSQLAQCRKLLKAVPYIDCAKKDNVLRIAFMTPGVNGVGSIGHVWWTFNSLTLESYGGHGVGSHSWSVYKGKTSGCFEVPSVSGVAGAATMPKAPAAAILATKGAKGALDYHRLQSAKLEDGRFIIDKVEVLTALYGDGRAPLVEFLKALGMKDFAPMGNHLDDPVEPRIYKFVEPK